MVLIMVIIDVFSNLHLPKMDNIVWFVIKDKHFGGESMFLLTAFLLAIGGVHMYILETPHTFPLPNMSMDQSTVHSVDLTSKHIFSVYSNSMFIIMTK